MKCQLNVAVFVAAATVLLNCFFLLLAGVFAVQVRVLGFFNIRVVISKTGGLKLTMEGFSAFKSSSHRCKASLLQSTGAILMALKYTTWRPALSASTCSYHMMPCQHLP